MKSYFREKLRADAFAGLTVAVMGVPQAMAYALIAGLPPVYGIYTAIVTCVVAAILGSSKHLVTGPTNALCMVMLSLTAHLPEKHDVSVIEIILLLSLMVGIIQMVFGLLRLGRIVRYVSNSVVIGFTAGAGILIAFNQVQNLLGIDLSDAHAERFYEVVIATIQNVPQANPYALGLGLATILIVLMAPKIDRRLPAALLGVAITGLVCYLLGWYGSEELGPWKVGIVRDIEPIRGSLPGFHLPELLRYPNYELTRELGSGALALALLGLVEAASISRAVASSSGQRINFTREFFGQGASQIVGSFFQCFAGSGSFTRTAVCYRSGGRTRMAAIFSAGWTALALVVFGDVANFIPKAALAGILIVIAFTMVDRQRLQLAWRSGKSSRLVLLGTLGSTLILPLEFAIFVGVFLSFVVVLRTTGKTDLTQLVTRTDGGFDEVPFKRAAASPVATVNMEGDFYFAAADDLDYELLECITPQTRVIVLRMKRLRAVGSTAMAMLGHFSKLLRERGLHLVVCGIEGELERVMTGSGLRQRLGEENIFYADNKLFQSTELALARAWSIVEMEQRDDLATKVMGKAPDPKIRAGDIMSPRCIRFGDQHQLREALWLMSELQKHTKSLQPTPLFLQDEEAKLAGKISPWQILGVLAAGVEGSRDLEDAAIGKMFRRDFARLIAEIARDDFARHGEDASLEDLLDSMATEDLQVVPICDDSGHIKGLVSADDVLRSVVTMLPDPDKGAAHG
ncbi:MAG: SulP family inorganic anion transporter [Planctomycetota bacterium]|jgi:SulP family sulfate permease|nr:SulP family inorganic anion transporter [Planctomycetota bacterium]